MAGARGRTTQNARPTPEWQIYSEVSLHPILAASLVEFQQHGYHGTTVRGIASRVGLTMPSLYYHYGNKEGILFALLEVAMDDLQTHIDMCLEVAEDTASEFENMITSIVLHYTHRRQLAMLHHEFRFLGPELRGQYVLRRARVEQCLEDILRRGVREGIFHDDDPHFTTRMLLGMLSGILDWYREGGPSSPGDIAERYSRVATQLVSTRHPDWTGVSGPSHVCADAP